MLRKFSEMLNEFVPVDRGHDDIGDYEIGSFRLRDGQAFLSVASLQDAIVEIGRSGVSATVQGLAAGFVLAFFAVRVLRSFVYGVSTHDALTLIAVPVILTVVAFAAAFVPTMRIATIEPAETLRAE